jgi:hypothetical protein
MVLAYRAAKKARNSSIKQMGKLGAGIVEEMDKLESETVKFSFKDKRDTHIKRWQFS